MKTLSLHLEDDLDAALTQLCAEQGREKAEVVADVLRKHLQAEGLRSSLRDPELARLYGELAAEDLALAEEGLPEYRRVLDQADHV
jgi:predicted transcriptional regulator